MPTEKSQSFSFFPPLFCCVFFHFLSFLLPGWKGKCREENWCDSLVVLGYHCGEKAWGNTVSEALGWCSGSKMLVLPRACWGSSPLGSNALLLPEQLAEDSVSWAVWPLMHLTGSPRIPV